MDLHKLTADEVRGWTPEERKEKVEQVRHELANIRMDIYTAKSQQSAKYRGLKKSLARLLTVSGQQAKAAAATN